MGEAARRRPRMTVEEFLDWRGDGDVRYELVRGVPVAMNPPRSFHRTIAANATAVAANALRERRPCRPEVEAGIRIAADDYYVADLAVTCAPIENAAWVVEPLLIVEILSPSTQADGPDVKIPDYQKLGSPAEIWAVDSERRRARIWRRVDDRWTEESYVGGTAFASGVPALEVALDELYDNTGL
jgi:Uma2 family endonuclease